GGEGVARLARIGLARLAFGGDDDRAVFNASTTEVVLDVQFGRRAGLDADARAVQLGRAGQVERAADHEALPIVVVHAGETEIRSRVAAHGPGRIAPQHVHATGADGVEALLRRQRRETHRIRVAEDGRRRGAAEIHVKAPPGAPVVGIGETDQTFVHAAVQAAALADR